MNTVTVIDYSRAGKKGFPLYPEAHPEISLPTKEVPLSELDGENPIEQLTPEQARYLMKDKTPRDFRDILIDEGVLTDAIPDEVTVKISEIPFDLERTKALNAWQNMTTVSRVDPYVDMIGSMFGYTPEDIDELWLGSS